MEPGPHTEPLPPPPGDGGREGAYAILRNRDFSLYLIARFIAALGAQMQAGAVNWELYERTHSTLMLGLIGLTQMAPMVLFFLPAGHVADNHDRKRTILAMILLAALSSVGLALVSAFRADVFWMFCCMFAGGIGRTFRSEEHTSELQSHVNLVCRLLLEKKNKDIFEHLGVLAFAGPDLAVAATAFGARVCGDDGVLLPLLRLLHASVGDCCVRRRALLRT